MEKKPWGGRFKKSTHKVAEKFSSSIGYDKNLYKQDIEGSIAHVTMLAEQKIIPKKDSSQIIKGLKQIRKEIESGDFPFREEYEDIHLNIEKRLTEIVGDVGGKIHTARSRNDQIALDTRLFIREATEHITQQITELNRQLVSLADKYKDAVMPLYTHMQRGQPVLLAHHLLAYFEMFRRDRERFIDCYSRVNVNPLGACAGAGTSFEIDRHRTSELLDFPEPGRNSIDSVSDRDFIAEFIFCCSSLMMHMSRLSEELVLWSSKEFDFVDLGDEFTTGSSIMPQKRNPDMSELTRGKTGRVYGDLMSILTLMKGLPLSYNRDMQEDKEPLFDSVETVIMCLDVNTEMLKTAAFNTEAMEEALQRGYLTATDVADYLAKKGVPFRKAHEISGSIVSYAEQQGKELEQITFGELKKFSDHIDMDILKHLSIRGSVESRKSYGGTAPGNVRKMITAAKRELSNWSKRPLKY